MTAKVTFNSDRCKGCELCTTVCPKHIVAIDQTVINRKGYHPAHVMESGQIFAQLAQAMHAVMSVTWAG